MDLVKSGPSTLGLFSNPEEMFSVTLVAQGYARIGLRDSTVQKLVKINNAIEYIYSVAELTSEYIVLITRHHMKNGKFMDYIERTA